MFEPVTLSCSEFDALLAGDMGETLRMAKASRDPVIPEVELTAFEGGNYVLADHHPVPYSDYVKASFNLYPLVSDQSEALKSDPYSFTATTVQHKGQHFRLGRPRKVRMGLPSEPISLDQALGYELSRSMTGIRNLFLQYGDAVWSVYEGHPIVTYTRPNGTRFSLLLYRAGDRYREMAFSHSLALKHVIEVVDNALTPENAVGQMALFG